MNLANLAPASRLDRVLAYLTDAVVVAAVLGGLWWFSSSLVLVGIALVELIVVLTLLRARTGRTPGGWVTGTVAIAHDSNHAPGLKRQFVRTFLVALLHLTVLGPVISGALSRDGRDWVDQMAGTSVVSLRREPLRAPLEAPFDAAARPLAPQPLQAPPQAHPFPQPAPPPPIAAPIQQAPAAVSMPTQAPFQAPAAQPSFQAPAAQPSFQAPAAQPSFQAPAAQPSFQAVPQAVPPQQAPTQPPPAPTPPPQPPVQPPQGPPQPSWPAQAPPAPPPPGAPQDPPAPRAPQPVPSVAPAQGIWDEAPDAFDPPTTRRGSIGWTQPQPLPSPQPSPADSPAVPPSSAVPRRAASAQSQPPAPSPLETQPLHQAVAEEPQATAAWLVLDSGQREPVDSVLVIGRSPSAGSSSERAVVVADSTQSLSRVHVRISPARGGVLVEDARSTNGTAIQSTNGTATPLAPDKRIWVPLGTTLLMGRRSMHVMAAD